MGNGETLCQLYIIWAGISMCFLIFVLVEIIMRQVISLSMQVTIEYVFEDGACKPLRVHTVVISTQHDEHVTQEQLRKDLMEKVVKPTIPAKLMDSNTVFHLNPSGKFIIGGPMVSFELCSLCLSAALHYL